MSLSSQAEDFAHALSATVRGVVGPHCPIFRADVMHEARQVTIAQDDGQGIPLSVRGQSLLFLRAEYRCEADHSGEFLRVRWSRIAVFFRDGTANNPPLIRYEFERPKNRDVPSAHLHIHHEGLCAECANSNISAVYQLGGTNNPSAKRAQARIASGKYAHQQDFHFPLGGERFRPCLEDFLHALIYEFGIDHEPGWQEVLEHGREQWRLRQTAAVVRDAPAAAVNTLRKMGYSISPPASGEVSRNRERLRAF